MADTIIKDTVTIEVTKTVCSDGSEVAEGDECPAGVSDIWKYIIGALAVILSSYSWGKGFLGLAKYWWRKGEAYEKEGEYELAEKCKRRAVKMAKTAFQKALASKYKKQVDRKYDNE